MLLVLQQTHGRENVPGYEPGDSKSFGDALAVDGDYLAVGDPEANRVVLYQRTDRGRWLRTQEIVPPKGSTADRAGVGFGHALDLNQTTLVIGSHHRGRWLPNGGIYTAEIRSDGTIPIREIPVGKADIVGYTLSLFGDKVAFAGMTEISPGRLIERILIADILSGQIIRVIGANIRPEEKRIWPTIESPDEVDFDDFFPNVAGHQDTLLIGVTSGPPKEVIYLTTAKGDLQRVEFEAPRPYPNLYAGSSVVLTDDVMAIGRSADSGPSDTLLLRRSAAGWSFLGAANLSGPLDASGSYVLISHGQKTGMPNNSPDPEHLLIRIDKGEIVVESEIWWQRREQLPIRANGLIDSDNLILSAEGRVVQLPIASVSKSSLRRIIQLPIASLRKHYHIRDCNLF